MDVMGLVLMVVVHAASTQEQDGACLVLNRLGGRHPRLRLIWADEGYNVHWLIAWVAQVWHLTLTIVKRPAHSHLFVLLPRRWVVERTFAWFNHYRILSKDYEVLPRNSEADIYACMIHLMLRRLAQNSPPPDS